ncbi:MAG TPA: hypothetical protein DCS67_10880 [Clostridiales bacterium UBA8960]|nr:hypothetical protein [Clostridiales bacterium UBA8960]
MTARYEMNDFDIEQFNESQTAKIVSIRKKRLEKENAKKIALHHFMNMLQSVLIVLVIAGLFSSYIYRNAQVNEAKYDIFNLKAEIKSLSAQIEELGAKIENQTGLKNIEKVAIETLGMKYPSKEQMVYIDSQYHFALGSTSPQIMVEPVVRRESRQPLLEKLVSALFNANK